MPVLARIEKSRMNLQYLDFEQPIAELEEKISELRMVGTSQDVNLSEAIERLQKECDAQTKDIFSNLSPWDITRIARHPKRPYTLDYIAEVFDDFDELHGDRTYADDPSIVGGLARLGPFSVMAVLIAFVAEGFTSWSGALESSK